MNTLAGLQIAVVGLCLTGWSAVAAGQQDDQAWSPPVVVAADAGPLADPSLAINAAGEALSVWRQTEGLRAATIWARPFSASSGWGIARRIQSDIETIGDAQHVVFNPSGHFFAVWSQSSRRTGHSIWANALGESISSTTAVRVSDSGASREVLRLPRLAVDAEGGLFVVWQRHSGRLRPRGAEDLDTVWAARFVPSTGWSLPAFRVARGRCHFPV